MIFASTVKLSHYLLLLAAWCSSLANTNYDFGAAAAL
jgi:hypothetical protein